MTDLTATQLADFRADIGDEDTPYAFNDTQIQRLWARSGENYNKLMVLAIRQLLSNAAKLYDYVSGFTRQEQEKVFQHLKQMLELWENEVSSENQVNVVGLAIIPPANNKDSPNA